MRKLGLAFVIAILSFSAYSQDNSSANNASSPLESDQGNNQETEPQQSELVELDAYEAALEIEKNKIAFETLTEENFEKVNEYSITYKKGQWTKDGLTYIPSITLDASVLLVDGNKYRASMIRPFIEEFLEYLYSIFGFNAERSVGFFSGFSLILKINGEEREIYSQYITWDPGQELELYEKDL